MDSKLMAWAVVLLAPVALSTSPTYRVQLDEKNESQRTGKKNKSKGRPMSDSGTKARFYHAVKDAHMAHLIKVDLKADLFSYTIDEDTRVRQLNA
jgi:hypothetical protein